MNIINDYCNNLKNKYLNTEEVLEQIEEIRDTLYIKIDEYQEKGYKYSDAANEAIASLGDIESLLKELTTDTKLVYQGRLILFSNILSALIVFTLVFIMWVLSINIEFLYSISQTASIGFFLTGFSFMVVLAVKFNDMRNLNKKVVIEINHKEKYKDMKSSIIGLIIATVAAIIINFYTSTFRYIWFVWATIGISNWFICTFIYYKFLNSNKFDVDKKK